MTERKKCVCRQELVAEPTPEAIKQAVREHQQTLHHQVAWYAAEEAVYRRPVLRRVA